MSIHNTMITIFVRDCNQISQSFYDSVIFDLQLHQLTCSCSHSACLSVHGYYRRTVKLSSGAIRLRVCRVKCSECGATHALLLSSMVPYSQILLSDQQRICKDYEEDRDLCMVCEGNPSIVMKTTSNPYSETTGSAGEKSCALLRSLSFLWPI